MYHYRLDDYKIREEIANIGTWFGEQTLRRKLEYIASDREEVSKNLDRLEAAVRAQLAIVSKTATTTKVFVERRNNDRVNFFVWYEVIPVFVLENHRFPWNRDEYCYECGDKTEFAGNQRAAALKFAEVLKGECGADEVIRLRF
jgi:hypothetical protein